MQEASLDMTASSRYLWFPVQNGAPKRLVTVTAGEDAPLNLKSNWQRQSPTSGSSSMRALSRGTPPCDYR